MFQGISNFANLMKQAREMSGKAAELKAKLADIRVEGAAGGGMVVCVATGDQKIVSCRIEPSLLQSGDAEMLEDLVTAAANQALEKARLAAAGEMQQLTAGLNIPGLDSMLSQFGAGDGST
ncbi:MAG: YbaB/EbfC family nucleoid-associated protein [Planctomycetaceae bacterium]